MIQHSACGSNMGKQQLHVGNQRGKECSLRAPRSTAQGYILLLPFKNVIRVQKKRVLMLIKIADGTRLGGAMDSSIKMSILQASLICLDICFVQQLDARSSTHPSLQNARCRQIITFRLLLILNHQHFAVVSATENTLNDWQVQCRHSVEASGSDRRGIHCPICPSMPSTHILCTIYLH